MKRLKIVIMLFSILFSADSISAQDIKSPDAYLENFAAGEKIFWFGEVVDINVHKNKKEVVIEWLCKYLELAEPIDIDLYVKQENLNKKRAPIKVRKTKEQFFVTVLRSPDMPVKVAKEAAESVMKSKHFAI